jgi:hypothetical protein
MCVGRDGLTLSDYNVGLRLLIALKSQFRAFALRRLLMEKGGSVLPTGVIVPVI